MTLEPRFLRLTDKFMEFVRRESGLGIIVCDESGTIVRATVRSRLGNHHAGAYQVMRGLADEYAVTAEEAAADPQMKEGVNCPIVVDGKRVATFGIAGPLSVTRPIARIAAVVLANWLKEMQREQTMNDAGAQVFAGVDDLAQRVDASAQEARQTAQAMAEAAAEVAEKVGHAEAVVATVQRIAQQSRILSINGSVEATRAGDHGRAFAVVAKDMTRLAEETKATAAAIQTTLSEISRAITHVQEAVARSAASASEQTGALQEVTRTVADLKQAMATLESDFGGQAGEPAARRPSRSLAAHRLAGRGTSPPVAPRG
jgi:sugar diacid utilization regulator